MRSPSRTRWMIRCFAACTASRPKPRTAPPLRARRRARTRGPRSGPPRRRPGSWDRPTVSTTCAEPRHRHRALHLVDVQFEPHVRPVLLHQRGVNAVAQQVRQFRAVELLGVRQFAERRHHFGGSRHADRLLFLSPPRRRPGLVPSGALIAGWGWPRGTNKKMSGKPDTSPTAQVAPAAQITPAGGLAVNGHPAADRYGATPAHATIRPSRPPSGGGRRIGPASPAVQCALTVTAPIPSAAAWCAIAARRSTGHGPAPAAAPRGRAPPAPHARPDSCGPGDADAGMQDQLGRRPLRSAPRAAWTPAATILAGDAPPAGMQQRDRAAWRGAAR